MRPASLNSGPGICQEKCLLAPGHLFSTLGWKCQACSLSVLGSASLERAQCPRPPSPPSRGRAGEGVTRHFQPRVLSPSTSKSGAALPASVLTCHGFHCQGMERGLGWGCSSHVGTRLPFRSSLCPWRGSRHILLKINPTRPGERGDIGWV